MRYSFSLESVNMLTSGPNFIYKQSKGFWVSYFKYIAAAGFRAVELPFNPFSSDPMAFETGRCGIPQSAQAIRSKYGSPEEFLAFLREIGIDEVSSVHAGANDAMLELAAAGQAPESYYGLFADMLHQAIEHTASLRARTLVISPSPELGWLNALLPAELDGGFFERTADMLAGLRTEADKRGVELALRAEFWSFFAGDRIMALADRTGLMLSPDMAHIHIGGEDAAAVVKRCGPRMACPLLSDSAFVDSFGNFKRINAEIPVEGPQKVFSDLGEGAVALLACAQAIQDAGYEGYVVAAQRKTLDVYRGLLKLSWYLEHEISRKLR